MFEKIHLYVPVFYQTLLALLRIYEFCSLCHLIVITATELTSMLITACLQLKPGLTLLHKHNISNLFI